jgi:PEP-CTERM motif
MKIKLIFVVLTVLTLATLARAGTIIYDNGAPNQQGGNEMTEWLQTEDFTLTGALTVRDIHFWDIETAPGYSGLIFYAIVGDTGGNPDFNNILTQGNTFLVTHTLTANGCTVLGFYCEYSNDFALLTIKSLAPGVKYHLLLHNGDLNNSTNSGMYWETTNPNGTRTGLECSYPNGACFSSWTDNGQEHAFYLTGTTPEPGTLVMLGTGVLGLAATLRRKLL